jgi:hypothetical protein
MEESDQMQRKQQTLDNTRQNSQSNRPNRQNKNTSNNTSNHGNDRKSSSSTSSVNYKDNNDNISIQYLTQEDDDRRVFSNKKPTTETTTSSSFSSSTTKRPISSSGIGSTTNLANISGLFDANSYLSTLEGYLYHLIDRATNIDHPDYTQNRIIIGAFILIYFFIVKILFAQHSIHIHLFVILFFFYLHYNRKLSIENEVLYIEKQQNNQEIMHMMKNRLSSSSSTNTAASVLGSRGMGVAGGFMGRLGGVSGAKGSATPQTIHENSRIRELSNQLFQNNDADGYGDDDTRLYTSSSSFSGNRGRGNFGSAGVGAAGGFRSATATRGNMFAGGDGAIQSVPGNMMDIWEQEFPNEFNYNITSKPAHFRPRGRPYRPRPKPNGSRRGIDGHGDEDESEDNSDN